jgi:hypothetical protein
LSRVVVDWRIERGRAAREEVEEDWAAAARFSSAEEEASSGCGREGRRGRCRG